MKLTPQEQNFLNYLKSEKEPTYEGLSKFCKKDTKLKTIKRVISDIKAKYKSDGVSFDFNITDKPQSPKLEVKPEKETLVQLRKTLGGNIIDASINIPDAQIDFKMDNIWKTIRTKNGTIKISESEWLIFEHLLINAEKQISIDSLKDVLYKNHGSKTPANWSDVIAGVLTKLRKNIPELKKDERLLTIRSTNTTYYMVK